MKERRVIRRDLLSVGDCKRKKKSLFIFQKQNENFCISHILRENNFEDSRSAKPATLTHSEALNLDFYDILHFWKDEIYQINKIQNPYNCKKYNFRTSRFSESHF